MRTIVIVFMYEIPWTQILVGFFKSSTVQTLASLGCALSRLFRSTNQS